MERASHEIRIRASREAIWTFLSDPSRLPDWGYGVRKVEFVTDARRGVGAQWRQTEVYGPVVLTRLMEVTEADQPTAHRIESVTRPRIETAYSLQEETAEDGEIWTRLTVEMEYELPFGAVGRAAEPAIGDFVGKAIARRSAENLKRLVEAREARKRDEPPVTP